MFAASRHVLRRQNKEGFGGYSKSLSLAWNVSSVYSARKRASLTCTQITMHSQARFSRCASLLLCRLLSLDLQNLPPLIETAVRASTMVQDRLMTVAAFTQRRHAQRIVSAATVTATFAQFSFW